jgi:nitroreductase
MTPAAPRLSHPADILDVIRQRRAVRDYLPDPLDTGVLCELVDAAVQAPSPMNAQAWSFYIVRSRAVMDVCSDFSKAHVLTKLTGDSPLSTFREGLANPDFDIFYNAPALVVICATTNETMAKQACCLAAENLMLAACAKGLGSCWIGFAEDWLNQPAGKSYLGIPATCTVVAPIIVGRPRAVPAAPSRRPAQISWVAEAA